MVCYYIWFRRVLPVVLCLVFILAGCKPHAIITIDRESGFAPLPVKFDASNSTDKGKDIKEYSWDFDNDGKFDAFGIKAKYTFNNPGAYTVRLRVTDSKNNISDTLITIKVVEASLRAMIAAGASACVSSPVSFDASFSIDKDNDISGYEWDFDNDGVIDASGVNADYSFPEEKVHTM